MGRRDATFCPRSGSTARSVSLESYNHPAATSATGATSSCGSTLPRTRPRTGPAAPSSSWRPGSDH
ncbi:AbfB domain-containing protein [Streptomyces canus]|uniref:AbfB domain-containing protein n=1 Tax=Streptomyces canus TaxID=58343 RepID=UPI0033B08562